MIHSLSHKLYALSHSHRHHADTSSSSCSGIWFSLLLLEIPARNCNCCQAISLNLFFAISMQEKIKKNRRRRKEPTGYQFEHQYFRSNALRPLLWQLFLVTQILILQVRLQCTVVCIPIFYYVDAFQNDLDGHLSHHTNLILFSFHLKWLAFIFSLLCRVELIENYVCTLSKIRRLFSI